MKIKIDSHSDIEVAKNKGCDNECHKNCKEKKMPERTCIACRRKADKGELLRIVRTPDGKILVDESKKADGRGVYVCNDSECIDKLIKKRLLNHAFKSNVDNSVYEAVKEAFVDKQEQI